ncbi:hypothetical protein RCC89_18665 [Cytophagaceae bacterium ABcell3]|nr:hypothetical protein RCC89_18665 [Cytophagaceae bacterium ABcell3]
MSVFCIFLIAFSANASGGPGKGGSSSPDSTGEQKTVLLLDNQNFAKRSKAHTKKSAPQEAKESTYKRWTNLKYSGYIRSYNQMLNMPVRYEELPAQTVFTFNGLDRRAGVFTGYQEPLFLLRLEGAPTSRTHFKVEYHMDHQLFGNFFENTIELGTGPGSTANRRIMNYRIFEFTAGANTNFGDFTLTSGGGVIWQKMSPFTLWNYEYRDDMFERFPWEPEGASWARYNTYYADQNIARDQRWGNTGTQGFVLDGRNLPGGFNFKVMYGKTDNSGGFQTYLARTPKNMFAFKVDKTLGRHKVGVNYFGQNGFTDSRARYRINQEILTADARLNFNDIKIYTEFGVGRWRDSVNVYDNPARGEFEGEIRPGGIDWDWDRENILNNHCFNMQVDVAKSLFGVPLSLQAYSIKKSVVNVNSQVLNTANPHAVATPALIYSPNDIMTIYNGITDVGQMANNRWATNAKYEDTHGKLKVLFMISAGQEHDNLFSSDTNSVFNNPDFNSVSFHHRSNHFTRSRFAYFQRDLGPYNRIISQFRRTFETIRITDPVADYKKGYNSIEYSLKYKFRVLDRDLIVSNYGNYNSVREGFSPVPTFTEEAFVRTFYEELMTFYAVSPKLTIIKFFSLERNFGNMRTELAENGKPMNQTAYGYGIGLDYDFSSRAGLFLRHRWLSHTDKNFELDRFRGSESTVELKIFF